MRIAFVVLTAGFWGKGLTISDAAKECIKAGSPKTELTVIRCITAPSEVSLTHADLLKEISVNGCGDILYPQGADCIRIISPQDGNKVKLSSL